MNDPQPLPVVEPVTDAECTAAERPVDCLTMAGRIVCVRPIVPADAEALLALHQRLSADNWYLRFFSAGAAFDAEVRLQLHLVQLPCHRSASDTSTPAACCRAVKPRPALV